MKRSSTIPNDLKPVPEENSNRSMVSLAQNMLSGKFFSYLSSEKPPEQDTSFQRQRRNSKSLPASPLASPRCPRKNPYFSDPFAKPNEAYKPGKPVFFLSITSTRKSIEDLTAYTECSANNSPKIPRHAEKIISEPVPQPSELREMNFWSPVSM